MESEALFRLAFFAIFASSMMVSGYYRKKARESGEVIARRSEGTSIKMLRVVLTLPLLLSILFYIAVPEWLAWAKLYLPLWLRITAAIFGALCILFMRWVFVSIGKNISETILTKKAHQLVTWGPYQWIRHPLYAVALFALLSLSILADNWFMLLLWVIGILVFRFVVIPKEEANLIKAFGEEYIKYQERTGALLPRLPFQLS